jgi:single-stranded-DNA-specific exonuclease
MLHQQSLIGRILAGRGITEAAEVELGLEALLQPYDLADFEPAVEHLCRAVQQHQRILIVGDYDADGATSTALACHLLRRIGASVDYLVPNRFEYGYGLSPAIVQVALERQPDLILTVDNGIASHRGIEQARAAGVTVVVTDHHLPPEQVPEADAIVNPNRIDCSFASKNICGVGVIFYVMVGLCRALQRCGYLSADRSPRMADYLDLVALGTVADVVPLDRNNRIFIEQGLRRIRAGVTRPGILALFNVASRNHRNATTTDMGFVVAPRLNAAGRLDDMRIGVECLLAEDMATALALAKQLDEFNRKRRQIESGMRVDGERQLEQIVAAHSGALPAALTVFDAQWHEGVIGILAGRLKEQYHRPVFAFARAGEGELKGSGRSIAGIHIRDVLMAMVAEQPDLLKKFGGHAMAAGVSLQEKNLSRFTRAFNQCVQTLLQGKTPQREWLTDGALQASEMTLNNAITMKYLQPWGQSFPAPLFDDVFEITDVQPVGNAHSRLRLCQPGSRRSLPAVAFNRRINAEIAPQWRVVYRLDVNTYRETESLQLVVEHLTPTGE